MKHLKLLCTALILILLVGCGGNSASTEAEKEKLKIAVGIVPEAEFVEKIAGDLVDVVVMIPPGYSPSNYQPTPKEMVDFSESKIYFAMGVNSETNNIIPKISDINSDMKVVMLRDEIGKKFPLIDMSIHYDEGDVHEDHDTHEDNHVEIDNSRHDHDHSGVDPHIWLSPKIAAEIVDIMVKELSIADPDNKDIYRANGDEYIKELISLHDDLSNIFEQHKDLKIIMYHPAYGYFARDYGIDIITIEENGKDATIKRLKEVIDLAKSENIKYIFYQEEFDSSQAETVAEEIGGQVIKVSPLSKSYIESLKDVGEKFKMK